MVGHWLWKSVGSLEYSVYHLLSCSYFYTHSSITLISAWVPLIYRKFYFSWLYNDQVPYNWYQSPRSWGPYPRNHASCYIRVELGGVHEEDMADAERNREEAAEKTSQATSTTGLGERRSGLVEEKKVIYHSALDS